MVGFEVHEIGVKSGQDELLVFLVHRVLEPREEDIAEAAEHGIVAVVEVDCTDLEEELVVVVELGLAAWVSLLEHA